MVEYWNHNPRVRGSSPFSVIIFFWDFLFSSGDYSSVVECLIVDQKVMGSIPINYPAIFFSFFFCIQFVFDFKINTLRDFTSIFSLNSSVVEHWTENPRVVGSIPALSKFAPCSKFQNEKKPAWRNGRRARLKI